MLGTHDLWLFVLSGFLLNVTPGPDTLYIVGQNSSAPPTWSTARLSRRLAPSAVFKRWFNRCVGSVFVFVGMRLALAHEH